MCECLFKLECYLQSSFLCLFGLLMPFQFVLCRPHISSALFFSYNMALGASYQVIVDTNFINFSIQNKVCL
jgi:hypothetical protein